MIGKRHIIAAVLMAAILAGCGPADQVTPPPAAPASETTTSVPAPTTTPPVATTTPPTVTAGSFCSVAGSRGVTAAGKAMICSTTAADSRLRWRAA